MTVTGRLPAGCRRGLRLKVVLALYVFAAALMPLAHHDLVCHATSTTHCTTCTTGSSAEAAADPAHLSRLRLTTIGDALCSRSVSPLSTALNICSGRAPPSAIA